MPVTVKSLEIIDLARLSYAPALEQQRSYHAAVVDARSPGVLLLVEHDPVITYTHRPTARKNLLAPLDQLAQLGIQLHETDRGGDITYHGPGQLVAYPILRMSDYQLNIGRYMRLLEQVVIDTVAAFNVSAHRIDRVPGVWTGADGQAAKLAAVGVRVSRGVTMHGLALNVDPDLTHFQTIIPCGLNNRAVTSLRALLGNNCPKMETVKQQLVTAFHTRLTPGATQ